MAKASCAAAVIVGVIGAAVASTPVAAQSQLPSQSLQAHVREAPFAPHFVLQCEEIAYDDVSNKVVFRGRLRFANTEYKIAADQLIFDRAANTLMVHRFAVNDRDRRDTRGDEAELTPSMRDGFEESFVLFEAGDRERILPERIVGRDPR